MSRTREQALVLGLLLAGLAARITAVFCFSVPPINDALAYHTLAAAMADGRGFVNATGPETQFPPGLPFVISLGYRVLGPSVAAAGVIQSLFDIATCTLLWWWTRRRLGAEAALWALALAITSLSALASVRVLRADCLASLLIVASLASVDHALTVRRGAWFGAAGVLFGLLTLVRWQFSLLPLFALPLLGRRAGRRALLWAPLVVGAYAVTLAPWLARNQRVLGAPVLSSQTGITLYSSHFRAPGQPYGNNTQDETTRRAFAMPPLAGSNFLVAETLHRLRARPSWLLRQYPIKLLYLFVPIDWEVIGNHVWNLTYLITAVLSLVGLGQAWRRYRELTLLWLLPILYLTVMALPFYGSPRFRLPAEPLLTPLAALGVLALRARWSRGAKEALARSREAA
jgi:hypothetical protein